MAYLFLAYPKCSTCRKAKAWLDEHKIVYEERHIVEQHPSAEELASWMAKDEIPLKKLFNTSGILYREMQLKDRLPDMTRQEQIDLLASNGMLVKRPLLVGECVFLAGFKEDVWNVLK